MQKARPDYFVDRMFLQQSAFLIQSKYEWDQANFGDMPSNLSDEERAKREILRYEIPPTYSIWICDFPVPKQKLYRGDWAVRNEEGFTPHTNPLRSCLRKKGDNVQLESSICRAASVPGLSLAPAYGVQFIPEPDVIEVEFVKKALANGNSGGTTTIKGRYDTCSGEFKVLQTYDLKGRKLNGKPTAKGVYYGKKVLIKW